jgi:hypothetical protein
MCWSSPDEKLIAALRAVFADEQCWIDQRFAPFSHEQRVAFGFTDIKYVALVDISLGLPIRQSPAGGT